MPANELAGALSSDSILLTWLAMGYSAVAMMTIVAVALLLSAYIKIATVLSIVRAGFGFYSIPSAFVTGSLALSLTFFSMYPTLQRATLAADRVVQSSAGVVTDTTRASASQAALDEWKVFLIGQSKPAVRARFVELGMKSSATTPLSESKAAPPDRSTTAGVAGSNLTIKQLEESWRVVVPTFVVSQLEEAFRTGFMLFLPLLVIELLVGATLLALGATQIDSGLVSLPLKILLFLSLDGWALITTNLVSTFSQ